MPQCSNLPTTAFPGILNWQRRLWQTVHQFIQARRELTPADLETQPTDKKYLEDEAYMFDSRNYYVQGVTFNITTSQQLSVAVCKMQGLTNGIRKASKPCVARGPEYERVLAAQIIMLAPLAPHFASELWAGFCSAPHRLAPADGELQWERDVLGQRWPKVDLDYCMKVNVKVSFPVVLEFFWVIRRKVECSRRN